jgi:serine/threonine protein kinase
LKIPYAVKVISKQELQASRHGKSTVFNETVLAALVDHPSIIEVIEIADSHSYIFQFMRLAERGDLLHRLRAAPIPQTDAFRIIDQLLAAVEYLHSYGICHRDIKLENILITRTNNAKLCDFGLAAVTLDGTVTGNCGSIEYAAPEAIVSPSFNGFAADIWSVGVVIYSLFARTLPYRDVHRSFDFRAASVDWAPVPSSLRPLIERMLSIDPAMRPSAADARAFDAMRATGGQRKPPLSALSARADLTDADELVSRLSQVLCCGCTQLTEKLASGAPCIEGVLFILLRTRLRSLCSDPLFRGAWRSLPSADTARRVVEASFPAASCDLYRRMHAMLMKQRCCVSSPMAVEPLIVQTRDAADCRLRFKCMDDRGASKLVLAIEEGSVELAEAIVTQMRSELGPML